MDQLPDDLRSDLSRLYAVEPKHSPAIDQAMMNRAQAHMAGRKRFRLLLRVGGAAAAAVVLAVLLWHPPATRQVAARVEDINRDGVVDIRDAMALQRELNGGQAKGGDVNRDGVTDRRDVDAVAMAAVRLGPGGDNLR
jgi:hypothetical protein